jgi:beta-glucosidase-like glycosyl hydrolase
MRETERITFEFFLCGFVEFVLDLRLMLAARTSVAATAKHFCAGGAASRDGTMRPADLIEAATLSLKAGVDIDMMSGAYVRCLYDR